MLGQFHGKKCIAGLHIQRVLRTFIEVKTFGLELDTISIYDDGFLDFETCV